MLKFDLIFFINFPLHIFCLMLIDEVVIGMAHVHQDEDYHYACDDHRVEGDEELLILAD